MGRRAPAAALLAVAAGWGCTSREHCVEAAPAPPASAAAPLEGGVSGQAHLLSNGNLLQDLIAGPLTQSALANDPAFVSAIADPATRDLLQYMVQCALPKGASFSVDSGGQQVMFEGDAGYAPEWATGPCGQACQEWVTGCLLARVNYWGVHVLIDLRSTNPTDANPASADLQRFSVQEGAFFGNYFTFPQRMYACRGTGWDPLEMTVRVCTDGAYPCGVAVVGTCTSFDGATGQPTDSYACDDIDQPSGGSYVSCHDHLATPDNGDSPPGDVYDHVVTTYLKSTSFSTALPQEHCK